MTQVTNTRQLVVDYVRYRLQRRGLAWPNGPDPGPSPGRVERTMRALGEEFQERYTQVFQEMCKQLDIRPNNAEETFMTTVSELFRDGVKWGRIVALFAFSGSLPSIVWKRKCHSSSTRSLTGRKTTSIN